MLVLSRKKNEKLIILKNIEITVLDVKAGVVKLGIKAPKTIPVQRQEIIDEIEKANLKSAMMSDKDLSDIKNVIS
jgi:carbon storage regulator